MAAGGPDDVVALTDLIQAVVSAKELGAGATGFAFFDFWLLITGKLFTRDQAQEWKDNATFWRSEAIKHKDALLTITSDMKELTRAIEALTPALKKLADDHEEAETCFKDLSHKLELWQS